MESVYTYTLHDKDVIKAGGLEEKEKMNERHCMGKWREFGYRL